jgi:hypothetical protein
VLVWTQGPEARGHSPSRYASQPGVSGLSSRAAPRGSWGRSDTLLCPRSTRSSDLEPAHTPSQQRHPVRRSAKGGCGSPGRKAADEDRPQKLVHRARPAFEPSLPALVRYRTRLDSAPRARPRLLAFLGGSNGQTHDRRELAGPSRQERRDLVLHGGTYDLAHYGRLFGPQLAPRRRLVLNLQRIAGVRRSSATRLFAGR